MNDRPAHSAKSPALTLLDLRNRACVAAWRARLAAYRAGLFVPVDPCIPSPRPPHEVFMSTDRLPLPRLKELRDVAQACVSNDTWTFGPLDEEDLVKALNELIQVRKDFAAVQLACKVAGAAS